MPQPPKTIAGPTPDSPRIALARIGKVSGRNDQVRDADWIDVHFNPASLQLQISNELKDTKNNERKQYIAKSNAKLTLDLQFDTTDSGDDVMQTTGKLQAFIAPSMPPGDEARQQQPPPVVLFEWGRVTFKGIVEAYKETIDFFSASGVPLRSSVNLTLSRQDQVFDDAPGGAPENAGDVSGALDVPAASASDISKAAESPRAARAIAAENGLEDLRFDAGAALTVSASVELKPPAAFAAAASGLSLPSPGAGVGLPGDGGLAGLARLSASEGAFAGLRVAAPAAPARINTERLKPPAAAASLSTDRQATFQTGGRARAEGPPGLRADVGTTPPRAPRLTFDVP
jgi:hypothetical protein